MRISVNYIGANERSMRIEFTDIQNFRKLKCCRINLSPKQTILVGPNNSGKTSAMDALTFFLNDKTKLKTQDFTLNNWIEINKLANIWLKTKERNEEFWDKQLESLRDFLPQIDIWIQASEKEIHHVYQLLPTLDWDGGRLGVRLVYEPKDLEKLFEEFKTAIESSQALSKKKKGKLKIWPKDFWAFLDRKSNLSKHFTLSYYLLDPSKLGDVNESEISPQKLPETSIAEDKDVLQGLVKVDTINAQRGFSDANANPTGLKPLSYQLREYYRNHLNPEDKPTEKDLKALESIESATQSFDARLKESFKTPFEELSGINYPGFGNPHITISSSLSPEEGINHESSVQFQVNGEALEEEIKKLSLPENTNGLGYQNIISIVFELIRFRDEWMKTGKRSGNDELESFQPLHLVLIEEPEAHLHAQVQQVFIKKAYDILRNHENLKDKEEFSTQLVVSTHSNHIAHEVDFNSLRYFKRLLPKKNEVATSKVINLSSTFGEENDTSRFATRYLKTTHSNLFFADVVIFVEGASERMLVPHFIKSSYENLSKAYLSIIEINGSHAHRLQPLIETLGVITLIITDIDPIDPKQNRSSVFLEEGKGYETSNNTLSKWIPNKKKLDALIKLNSDQKISTLGNVRVAYQTYQDITNSDKSDKMKIVGSSFEDSLVHANMEKFRTMDGFGLIKDFKDSALLKDLNKATEDIYKSLRKGRPGAKAQFALDLIFQYDPKDLVPPKYIKEGLDWVEKELKKESI